MTPDKRRLRTMQRLEGIKTLAHRHLTVEAAEGMIVTPNLGYSKIIALIDEEIEKLESFA